MTLSEIKKKMLSYHDFYGGDLLDIDLIQEAKTKKELAKIIERHRSHMEDMLSDANSHLSHFKKQCWSYIIINQIKMEQSQSNLPPLSVKSWRGDFEILPLKDKVEVGDYYLVDYNCQSHAAAPDKEPEVIKVISGADQNGYYKTDRGTQFKGYCIVHRLRPLSVEKMAEEALDLFDPEHKLGAIEGEFWKDGYRYCYQLQAAKAQALPPAEIDRIENELVEDILSEFQKIGIDTSEWGYKFGDGNFAHEFIAAGVQDYIEKVQELKAQALPSPVLVDGSTWKLKGHSYQIADTGDYDGYYEITNDKISLLTKDDDEEALQPIVEALNNSGCKFYQEDFFEFENMALKEENKRLLSKSALPINREILEALKEYNQLLSDELTEVVSMVAVHGWRSTRFEKGKSLREKIAELEAAIQSVEDK